MGDASRGRIILAVAIVVSVFFSLALEIANLSKLKAESQEAIRAGFYEPESVRDRFNFSVTMAAVRIAIVIGLAVGTFFGSRIASTLFALGLLVNGGFCVYVLLPTIQYSEVNKIAVEDVVSAIGAVIYLGCAIPFFFSKDVDAYVKGESQPRRYVHRNSRGKY